MPYDKSEIMNTLVKGSRKYHVALVGMTYSTLALFGGLIGEKTYATLMLGAFALYKLANAIAKKKQ